MSDSSGPSSTAPAPAVGNARSVPASWPAATLP